MPIVPPAKLAELQKNAHCIRNVCVLAHVDHGKTTLSDALLATNGIISSKLAGKIRYLDSREDEQERGITMETSGISLYYRLPRDQDTPGTSNGAAASEYLVNLIDSPGHVDFASEVASAARLSDGALVLVDVVEGVCTQTVSVMRQAWVENVRPILFLNKIDRLIVEWRMTPSEAYVHLQQLIEQVNAVLAGFWEGDRLAEDSRRLEAAKEKWREAHGDDAPMTEWYLEEKDDSHIYFSPELGNVLFGSAIDGWAFRANHFAQIFAEKLGLDSPARLQPLMWGDYFIDPKSKHRVLNRKQYSKLYGASKAAAAMPLFVQLCLRPVWQVYECVVVDLDQEKIDKVIEVLAIKVLPRDRKSKDRRMLLMAIMQAWLSLAQACMVAIVDQLPSPVDAQPLRLPHLVRSDAQQDGHTPVDAQSEVEKALYECMPGTASAPEPAVAYIGKIVSVPRSSLPEFAEGLTQRSRITMSAGEMRARGRDAVRRELTRNRESATGTPLSALSGAVSPADSGAATPLCHVAAPELCVESLAEAMESGLQIGGAEPDPDAEEDEVLVGFGRLYSGTVSVGDKLWAMQPKYNAKDARTHCFLKQINVRALYMMMGREFVLLQSVPAGSVFGIRGVAGAILKSGTLASDAQACPNLAAMHSESHPIVRVAIEPANPQDMARLVHGLELLNQADPCVQVISQATGERVLVAAGELHLERCLKDLRERFALCEFHVSEPIVPFKEGIVRQSAQQGVVLGEVGASGRQLAIIARQPPSSSTAAAVAADSAPRGEVSLTTANGLVTIVVRVEPLPEATASFLARHEADIQRVVKLTSSQRRQRLNAAAEALGEDSVAALVAQSDAEGGTLREARPSRLSELGPWLQSGLQQTFAKAKGWEPQRVKHILSSGLRVFGPRRAGPNMLIYSKEVLEQAGWSSSTWFRQREPSTLGSSFAATPCLSEDDSSDAEDSPAARSGSADSARAANTIRDFEESVNTGFQLATQSGPLCLEPLSGVAVTIERFVFNSRDGAAADGTPEPERATPGHGGTSTAALSGQIITTVRDAVKTGFLHWSPRIHLAMYTCDIQATSEVLGKVYAVINRRRGRVLLEEMREGTPYFMIKAAIPIIESFGFADEIRKRTSGAAIPLLIFRGFESLDIDPFWVPTTEEELEDLGEKADRENVAKKYMDKVRKRKGLFVERKIVEHAEKQRTLKK
ncbi:Cytoplasmic GTPase/eEF2-like protein (ribosomal biogenesis) [Coemansia biformis]|uniref:Ribosome assembly protein 1 n=1 Tax=Coemansia biformis TaxID=1286918 RepID=A0A9W8CYD5_9FUNG|nr:Cytoplasmic GTPase/eEF2-like protein (ribosomal biogenesis) [Coemansia biformis]